MFSFQKDEALAQYIQFEDAEILEDRKTNALELVVRSPDKDPILVEEILAVNQIQQWLGRVSWSPRR